jgi:hypothetical protein
MATSAPYRARPDDDSEAELCTWRLIDAAATEGAETESQAPLAEPKQVIKLLLGPAHAASGSIEGSSSA